MGKKDKNKKKGKGAEKTAMKTDKKQAARQKKMLEKLGEVRTTKCNNHNIMFTKRIINFTGKYS